MKNIKFFLIYIIFSPLFSFAYDDTTTHPAITKAIIDFYNAKYEREISEEEGKLLIDGSIKEDSPAIRSLNHFYDPIRNIGINNGTLAKDWALNRENGNEFSLPTAIDKYGEGKYEEAFFAFGHILHLLSDMGVPEHTRNDPHIGDGALGLYTNKSPFENWAKDTKTLNTISDLGVELSEKNNKKDFSSIKDIFDFLAKYSNNNFFSQDTIESNNYTLPDILEMDNRYAYVFNEVDREKYKLAITYQLDDDSRKLTLLRGNDTSVLSDYFTYLSKQVVIAGANALDIFIQEGEKARLAFEEKRRVEQERIAREAILLHQKLSQSGLPGRLVSGFSFLISDITGPVIDLAGTSIQSVAGGIKGVTQSAGAFARMGGFTTQLAGEKVVDQVGALASAINASANNALDAIANSLESKTIYQQISPVIALSGELQSGENQQSNLTTGIQIEDNTSLDPTSVQNSLPPSLSPPISPPSNQTPLNRPFMIPGFGGGGSGGGSVTNISNQSSDSTEENPVEKEEERPKDTTPPEKPIVSTPSDTSKIFNTEDILFAGIGEAGALLTARDSAFSPLGTAVINESGDWQITLSLANGENTIYFEVKDGALNISEKTEIKIIIDTDVPDILLSDLDCDTSILEVCLLYQDKIDLSWSSTSLDLDYFVLEEDGAFSITTATSSQIILSENKEKHFSIKAKDRAGNESEIKIKKLLYNRAPIIINEVAWNGTPTSGVDEWIELYNRSDYTINLKDFVLKSEDNSPYIDFEETHQIPAHGYFLIERKNDGEIDEALESPVKEIADLWTSFGSGLANDGEALYLLKASSLSTTTMDEIPYCRNWCGNGSDTKRMKTMERKDTEEFSDPANNWGTSSERITRNFDNNGKVFYGTPKKRNTLNYFIQERELNEPEVILKKVRSPYILPKDHGISINKNVKVEPGVVVKSIEGGLYVYGNFEAIGTPEEPIIFTSLLDDEYGGDIDNNGTSTSPSPGNWFGVNVYSPSESTVVSNAIFRWGGKYYTGSSGYKKSNFSSESKNILVENSVFENSRSINFSMWGEGGAEIKNNIFRYANTEIDSKGVYYTQGRYAKLFENQFVGNKTGLLVSGGGGEIYDNKFEGNTRWAGTITFTGGLLGNNEFVNNAWNGLALNNYVSTAFSTTTIRSSSAYYIDPILSTMEVPTNSTLIIEPGSTLKMGSRNLQVKGHLKLGKRSDEEGFDPDKKVYITSLSDDSVGGDTDANGETLGSINTWSSIQMSASSTSEIGNAVIRFMNKGVSYDESPIYLENTLFEKNNIAIDNSKNPPVIKYENVDFEDNIINKILE